MIMKYKNHPLEGKKKKEKKKEGEEKELRVHHRSSRALLVSNSSCAQLDCQESWMWVAAPKLSKVPFLGFHYIQYYDVLSMLSIEYNFLCVTLREIFKKLMYYSS